MIQSGAFSFQLRVSPQVVPKQHAGLDVVCPYNEYLEGEPAERRNVLATSLSNHRIRICRLQAALPRRPRDVYQWLGQYLLVHDALMYEVGVRMSESDVIR